MMRIRSSLGSQNTTRTNLRSRRCPMMISCRSPSDCHSPVKVLASASRNTAMASSKLTPCFLMLDRALALSHSKNAGTTCLRFSVYCSKCGCAWTMLGFLRYPNLRPCRVTKRPTSRTTERASDAPDWTRALSHDRPSLDDKPCQQVGTRIGVVFLEAMRRSGMIG